VSERGKCCLALSFSYFSQEKVCIQKREGKIVKAVNGEQKQKVEELFLKRKGEREGAGKRLEGE